MLRDVTIVAGDQLLTLSKLTGTLDSLKLTMTRSNELATQAFTFSVESASSFESQSKPRPEAPGHYNMNVD